jgi:prepilin-type N-terminal cleavage/methylation domain-containing protein
MKIKLVYLKSFKKGFTPLKIWKRSSDAISNVWGNPRSSDNYAGCKFLTGFTLIEIMVVLVIVGLTMGYAVPSYLEAIERARNREAINMIKSMATAAKNYYLKHGQYVGCNDPYIGYAGTDACSSLLGLNLPKGDWVYALYNATPNSFSACAMRDRGLATPRSRAWWYDYQDVCFCSPNTNKYCPAFTGKCD